MLLRTVCSAGAAALVAAAPAFAAPLTGTFTYQGQLVLNGTPVDGAADLRFQLYNAEVGGLAVGALSEHLNQAVFDGLFTVLHVNPGQNVFNGTELWVEISARVPAGGGAWTALAPRQRLAPAPYAIHSMRPWQTSNNDIFFDGSRVGIGTTTPQYRLDVRSTAPRAIFGLVTNPNGNTQGVFGQSDSDGGEGVMGWASANTGTTSGVYGQSDSSAGRGVYGLAGNGNGTNYGVFGEARGPFGSGVFGLATSNNQAATADGVRGQTQAVFGAGVHGVANHATGVTYGVRGSVASPNGWAGYFEGRGLFTGRLGVGAVSPLDGPLGRLHVVNTSQSLSAATALNGEDIIVEDRDAVLGLFSADEGSGGSAIALGSLDGTFGSLLDKWTIVRETRSGGTACGLRLVPS